MPELFNPDHIRIWGRGLVLPDTRPLLQIRQTLQQSFFSAHPETPLDTDNRIEGKFSNDGKSFPKFGKK